jgi:uncharacterized damage-inducible protein DinB
MSNEANLYLLSKLPAGSLGDRYSPRTRDVASQFAHMHSVRLRWLRHAAPDLVGDAEALPKEPRPNKTALKKALKASERLVASFLDRCEEAGKVKAWNGPPESFLAYLVAHEAHHRGLAMVALRAAGRKLPEEAVYGQWQWGKKRSLRG